MREREREREREMKNKEQDAKELPQLNLHAIILFLDSIKFIAQIL